MRRAVVPLVVLVGVIAIGVYYRLSNQHRQEPEQPPVTIENRIPKLKMLIAEQEKESAQAVVKYASTTTIKTRIDDLDSPVVDLLRQLPGVVQVDVGVAAKKPTSRIVHLLDSHSVPKELYALDMRQAQGRELTAEEIDQIHQELFLEVELVQLDQIRLLKCRPKIIVVFRLSAQNRRSACWKFTRMLNFAFTDAQCERWFVWRG